MVQLSEQVFNSLDLTFGDWGQPANQLNQFAHLDNSNYMIVDASAQGMLVHHWGAHATSLSAFSGPNTINHGLVINESSGGSTKPIDPVAAKEKGKGVMLYENEEVRAAVQNVQSQWNLKSSLFNHAPSGSFSATVVFEVGSSSKSSWDKDDVTLIRD